MNCKLISEVTNASTWTKTPRTAATFCSFYIIITTNKQKEAHFTSQWRFPSFVPYSSDSDAALSVNCAVWFSEFHNVSRYTQVRKWADHISVPGTTNKQYSYESCAANESADWDCVLFVAAPTRLKLFPNLKRINFINQKQRKNQ